MSVQISGDVLSLDGGRIVVTRVPNGFTVRYNDPNPETRWLPPDISLIDRLRIWYWRGGSELPAILFKLAGTKRGTP